MSRLILIVGASARAAAFSALRGDWQPYAIDLFADEDLARSSTAIRVGNLSQGLLRAADAAPAAPWIYTGGLESRPRLVDRLAALRPLLGNPGRSLRRVRDPWQVSECVVEAGLRYPALCDRADALPRDGTWLRKGRRSTGGRLVASWDQETSTQPSQRGWYFQERIFGQPCAAVYVAATGRANLLGVTRQLLVTERRAGHWTGARPFCYAGSVGPVGLSPDLLAMLRKLGDCLSDRFGLAGLFGVDLVIHDEAAWPVEVNPRFPASVEVLERASGFSAVQLHVDACVAKELPADGSTEATPLKAGKAIWFASHKFAVTTRLNRRLHLANDEQGWPAVTDIPPVGTAIRTGAPVATVHSVGGDLETVEANLRESIEELDSLTAAP